MLRLGAAMRVGGCGWNTEAGGCRVVCVGVCMCHSMPCLKVQVEGPSAQTK